MDNKKIGIDSNIFKTRREDMSLSLREVEDLTGVNRSAINDLENGIRVPVGTKLLKLMIFFNLSKEDVVISK